MHYENTLDFARSLDAQDSLRSFRDKFIFPKHGGEDVLYFCGNSLGLQPKTVRQALLDELDQWATHGVEGHFRGKLPWMYYHKFLTPQTARLVGALPHEVVVMNTLTVNLHLAMVSFYRPTPQRYKIVMEAGAFPSDQYAVESQVRRHGFDPEEAIVEVSPPRPPRGGEGVAPPAAHDDKHGTCSETPDSAQRVPGSEAPLPPEGGLGGAPVSAHDDKHGTYSETPDSAQRVPGSEAPLPPEGGLGGASMSTDQILQTIEKEGDKIALVLFGGVNYYTGQFYDLEKIAAAAHRAGAYVGFDLAHAAGNLPLKLHDWNADFAVWCSYKYLNSGPGGPAGMFIHERHGDNPSIPRFAGWWGHDEGERFQMKKGFKPMRGAEGWQLSNAQIFSFAAHKASLDIFDAAGMENLRAKSLLLTGFLEFVLNEANREKSLFRIITPRNPAERGCQLSLLTDERGKALFDYLTAHGAIADWREPNVIRLAPAPLYNSFEDVWRLGALISAFSGL